MHGDATHPQTDSEATERSLGAVTSRRIEGLGTEVQAGAGAMFGMPKRAVTWWWDMW